MLGRPSLWTSKMFVNEKADRIIAANTFTLAPLSFETVFLFIHKCVYFVLGDFLSVHSDEAIKERNELFDVIISYQKSSAYLQHR